MKRISLSFVSLLLVVALLNSVAYAGAAAVQLTVKTEQTSDSFLVSGVISSGAGKWVTIRIHDASGTPTYIGQTVSGPGGNYSFAYKPATNGTYRVHVGGEGIAEVETVTASFFREVENDPGPGLGGIGFPSSNVEHKHQQTVTREQLSKAQDGKVVIDWAESKEELLIPTDLIDALENNQLVMTQKQLVMSVPSLLLQQLKELAEPGAVDSQIVVSIQPLEASTVQPLITGSDAQSQLRIVPGQAYSFDLHVRTGRDKQARLKSFPVPVTIAFSYAGQTVNKDLLGVYYYNLANKQWEYMGGHPGGVDNVMYAELPHFSTYALLEYDKTYRDVPESFWGYKAIRMLSAKHIVQGVTSDTFEATRAITRAEYTALLLRTFASNRDTNATPGNMEFIDVTSSDWFYDEVRDAYAAKLVQGRTAFAFEPNESVTREEMAALIVRAYEMHSHKKIESPPATSFADWHEVSEWAQQAVSTASALGLMNGMDGNRFVPAANSSRAEAAQTIYNLIKTVETERQ